MAPSFRRTIARPAMQYGNLGLRFAGAVNVLWMANNAVKIDRNFGKEFLFLGNDSTILIFDRARLGDGQSPFECKTAK